MLRRLTLVCAAILLVSAVATLNITITAGTSAPSSGLSIAVLDHIILLDTNVVGACMTGTPDPYPC